MKGSSSASVSSVKSRRSRSDLCIVSLAASLIHPESGLKSIYVSLLLYNTNRRRFWLHGRASCALVDSMLMKFFFSLRGVLTETIDEKVEASVVLFRGFEGLYNGVDAPLHRFCVLIMKVRITQFRPSVAKSC